MKTFVRYAGLAILIGAAIWWATWFFRDERKVIRSRLQEIPVLIGDFASPAPLTQLSAASDLASRFAHTIEFAIDVPQFQLQGTRTRQEMFQMLLASRSTGQSPRIQFLDINVELLGKDSATAHFTLKVESRGEVSAQEIKTALIRVEREWLIQKAETVKTLQ